MKDLQLPDFMKYSDKYSATGFVEKISHIAKRAGAKLVYAALILYYTLQSKDVPLKDKAIIIGALGYLISMMWQYCCMCYAKSRVTLPTM